MKDTASELVAILHKLNKCSQERAEQERAHVGSAVETLLLPCEQELTAILCGERLPGEQIYDFFRRKEHAIGALFARLSVSEARTLHRRLANPVENDPLAPLWIRMISARRDRLLAFLADARRREALAGCM
jgi:hypothetical protein